MPRERLLDEHQPAERRNRRVRGEELPALKSRGAMMPSRSSPRVAAGDARADADLGQGGQVALLEDQADVRVGDQVTGRVHRVGVAQPLPTLIWETTSQMALRLTSATVTSAPYSPAGTAMVM